MLRSLSPVSLYRLSPLFQIPARAASSRLSSTVSQLLDSLAAGESTPGSTSEYLTVNGFVRSIRKQKRVAFAAISDGSSLEALQAVLTPEQAKGLSTGAAVSLTGHWEASPSGKEQACELQVQSVTVLGDNDAAAYPIQKKYHTPDFLRTLPHLRTRLPYNALLLRLRSQVIGYVTTYFSNEGFVQTHPPIITSSDCEGAGEVFSIGTDQSTPPQGQDNRDSESAQFFRAAKYLTVSSQLHLEALAQSVGKVWALSPTFRAEQSDTPRHLSEFYMLEAELCFVEDVNEVMDLAEDLLREVASQLQKSRLGEELLSALGSHAQGDSKLVPLDLKTRWEGLTRKKWPRITYADAISELQDATSRQQVKFEFAPKLGFGLQAEHERYLAETVGRGSPIFVTDYPRSIKAFYMAPSKTTGDSDQSLPKVGCFDLLVPDLCEIVGGSMREHRLSPLLDAMSSNGLLGHLDKGHGTAHATDATARVITQDHALEATRATLEWYIDLRRFGSVPHGGFGIGFDRLLCYLSGVSNIRDVVSFPRWHGRCDC